MTWWELLYYFCDYIEERELRMKGVNFELKLISNKNNY